MHHKGPDSRAYMSSSTLSFIMMIIGTPNYVIENDKKEVITVFSISGAYRRLVAISRKKKNRTKKISQKMHNQNGTEVIN